MFFWEKFFGVVGRFLELYVFVEKNLSEEFSRILDLVFWFEYREGSLSLKFREGRVFVVKLMRFLIRNVFY